jgi:succinate dehydrogenase / fumarate reductase flavoprotein subunit
MEGLELVHEYAAIVVGAGGAGLYAALEASRTVKTAVLSKLYPMRSHTGAAQGGISAALGNIEEDSPDWHAFDTVKGGDYLTDQSSAILLAEDAVRAVLDLENRGLPFNRTPEGRIDQRRFGSADPLSAMYQERGFLFRRVLRSRCNHGGPHLRRCCCH